MCAYLGDDEILCKIKENAAAKVVQIDVEFYVKFGTQLFIKPVEYQSHLTYPVVKNTNTEKHRHTE